MILTAALLLIRSPQAKVSGTALTVSITGKDLPLATVFKEIEKQTSFHILTKTTTLKRSKPVTLDITNATIDDVLQVCLWFQPHKLYYTKQTRSILIWKAQATPSHRLPKGSSLLSRVGISQYFRQALLFLNDHKTSASRRQAAF